MRWHRHSSTALSSSCRSPARQGADCQHGLGLTSLAASPAHAHRRGRAWHSPWPIPRAIGDMTKAAAAATPSPLKKVYKKQRFNSLAPAHAREAGVVYFSVSMSCNICNIIRERSGVSLASRLTASSSSEAVTTVDPVNSRCLRRRRATALLSGHFPFMMRQSCIREHPTSAARPDTERPWPRTS